MLRIQSLIELARVRQQEEESEETDSDTSSSSSSSRSLGPVGKGQEGELKGAVDLPPAPTPREPGDDDDAAVPPRGSGPAGGTSKLAGLRDERLLQGGRSDGFGENSEGMIT